MAGVAENPLAWPEPEFEKVPGSIGWRAWPFPTVWAVSATFIFTVAYFVYGVDLGRSIFGAFCFGMVLAVLTELSLLVALD